MVNTQLSDSPPPYDDEDIHLYLRNDLEDNLDVDEKERKDFIKYLLDNNLDKPTWLLNSI